MDPESVQFPAQPTPLMKRRSLLAAAACQWFAVFASSAETQGLPVEVITDQHGPEIFPAEWLGGTISAEADPLPEADRPRAIDVLSRALKVYPAAVLKRNLAKVYVVGRLRYSGVTAGGTRSGKSVYLVASGERYTPEKLTAIFHAEFSSILFRNHAQRFDDRGWTKLLPDGFSYAGSGVAAIKTGQASQVATPELLAEGFLSEYSKSSMEEDFNAYAADLLTGDALLWQAVDQYERVKAKANRVMAFYEKLDAHFTREWFLSIRQP
jgi:hypothetical protein